MKIVELKLNELTPFENNAKIHTDKDVDVIANSIKEFGMNDPIGIWGDKNIIVEGHGRLLALKKLGYETVPCIRLDHLTDEQRRMYTLTHNKSAELSEWDFEKLEQEMKQLEFELSNFGFDEKELMVEFNKNKETEEDDFDVEENLPEEPTTKRGQLWKLGNHYLMCGDSTNKNDVEKLMQGNKADMVFTDPPYGVDYKGINNDSRDGLKTLLDNAFFNMMNNSKAGASIYCFHSDRCADIFNEVFRKYCHFSSMIIWKKQSLVLSQTDYQSIHEPCMYGWFNNGTHNFYGDRKQTSVWEYDRKSVDGHTTPKPIELICKALENSSQKNNIILDLFGGSGSTLIACEQLNRQCFTMELDEKYCDVIIKRYEQLTGQKVVLVD